MTLVKPVFIDLLTKTANKNSEKIVNFKLSVGFWAPRMVERSKASNLRPRGRGGGPEFETARCLHFSSSKPRVVDCGINSFG